MGYFWREAARGVRHTGWMSVASVLTVSVALFVLGVFGVLSINLEHAANALNRQVELQAYFKPSMKPAAEHAFLAALKHEPGVRRVIFVSKTQALGQLKKEFPTTRRCGSSFRRAIRSWTGLRFTPSSPARFLRWRGRSARVRMWARSCTRPRSSRG